MQIIIIDTKNSLRNYNYLVGCPETQEAVAIDPLAADMCLAKAAELGWRITHVVNTHEHGDHTGGNQAVIAATQAKLCAHFTAPIDGIDIKLHGDQQLQIGNNVRFTVLDTPGHTQHHICLFGHDHDDTPVIFSGDTLFNAGVGNCHNGGDPHALYQTFANQIERLPDTTRVYPGHDYIENNLNFAASVEPSNPHIKALCNTLQAREDATPYITTLREERLINPFLRTESDEIEHVLREKGFTLPLEQVKREDIFLALRHLRNQW